MKKRMFGLLFLAVSATVLQADSRHILRASFPDGTGLEIFTQTTGSSQIDPQGEMGIGPGVGSNDHSQDPCYCNQRATVADHSARHRS